MQAYYKPVFAGYNPLIMPHLLHSATQDLVRYSHAQWPSTVPVLYSASARPAWAMPSGPPTCATSPHERCIVLTAYLSCVQGCWHSVTLHASHQHRIDPRVSTVRIGNIVTRTPSCVIHAFRCCLFPKRAPVAGSLPLGRPNLWNRQTRPSQTHRSRGSASI